MILTLIFSGFLHRINGPTFIGYDMVSTFSEKWIMEKQMLCSCALHLCLNYNGKGLIVF